MAFYDDLTFIFSHIRNSYVTSDDTGMCELVILNETLPFKQKPVMAPQATMDINEGDSLNENFSDQAHSLDIVSDMDLVAHRRRSNTAQRLDRLKKERQSQAMIKHIHWRESPDPPPADDLQLIFPKKELNFACQSDERKIVSLLSVMLDKHPSIPTNPFTEFAKFAGNSYVGAPTKRINIFLTMLPPEQRAYPMLVTVVSSAKVQDLIGVICWKYTEERREPKLKNSIDYYSLHIAEDDGEVDLDFPCLDPKEIISKFGFSVLALVEKGTPCVQQGQFNISIQVPGEKSVCTFSVETLGVTLQDVLERFTKQKIYMQNKGGEYRLAKKNDPDFQLNMHATLSSCETTDFLLIKDSQKREEITDCPLNSSMALMEAPLYQSYVVSILSRVRAKTVIHLGISGEKIEIVPVQPQKGSRMIWSRTQKPVSYDTDNVASCDIVDVKSTGKSTFRLTCAVHEHDYKQHDFEVESKKANEIVQKINCILQLRSSQVRKDYLVQKERKMTQKRTFTLSNK